MCSSPGLAVMLFTPRPVRVDIHAKLPRAGRMIPCVTCARSVDYHPLARKLCYFMLPPFGIALVAKRCWAPKIAQFCANGICLPDRKLLAVLLEIRPLFNGISGIRAGV